MTVGVFNGDLCFADATQPTDRVYPGVCIMLLAGECVVKTSQDILAPGEIQVEQVWNIPDRGGFLICVFFSGLFLSITFRKKDFDCFAEDLAQLSPIIRPGPHSLMLPAVDG